MIGVEAQMLTFDFLFGLSSGTLTLRHSENLSKSLQHEHTSAAEGQELVKLTHKVLKSLRQLEQFQLFYQRVLKHQETLGISPPTLPRKRRAPRYLELGLQIVMATSTYHLKISTGRSIMRHLI